MLYATFLFIIYECVCMCTCVLRYRVDFMFKGQLVKVGSHFPSWGFQQPDSGSQAYAASIFTHLAILSALSEDSIIFGSLGTKHPQIPTNSSIFIHEW